MLEYGNLTTESGSIILPVVSFIILLFVVTITIIVINNHKKNTRNSMRLKKGFLRLKKTFQTNRTLIKYGSAFYLFQFYQLADE